ncbi:hypothetical protein [Kitasatospora sp. NPDC002040]|uniref:hypothetical protein n=1 Tax=Kitasatospora sp. NPDC002040 TaxID=3154661 RepID=UPI00331B489F
MNATALHRIVTIPSGRTRRGRRLAVAVPPAAVLSVGVVGCGAGAAAPKKRFTFRVTTVGVGNAGLEYTVGAVGDVHRSVATKF